MEFRVGAGLACLGIAVGIAQWLLPPDKIAYEIRFILVVLSCLLFVIGVGLLIHVGWQHFFKRDKAQKQADATAARLPNSDPFPVPEFISMKSAAIKLNEAFPRRFILERAKENLVSLGDDSGPEYAAKLLKLAAIYIASKIPVHGRDRAGKFTKIAMNDLLNFSDDATVLQHAFYFNTVIDGTYTDVAVRIEEFEALLEEEGMELGFRETFRGSD